jgi:benzoyl-CoA reductase subunit B
MFSALRGTTEGIEYDRALREEVQGRRLLGFGPKLPEGWMEKEKFRLVVEGPSNWTSFREFWKMFYDESAVVVASTYTTVGGLYGRGFRHNPDHPREGRAQYCLGCDTNRGLPTRIRLLEQYIREYQAVGFLINSVKSCNSFCVGQLFMLRKLKERTGVPGGFIESDLVDPRYFSAANIKNRLECYLQMLEKKRAAAELRT